MKQTLFSFTNGINKKETLSLRTITACEGSDIKVINIHDIMYVQEMYVYTGTLAVICASKPWSFC